MYTHVVLQIVTMVNLITGAKSYETVEIHWGSKAECEEYVMSNKGRFKIVPMDEEQEFYYNYKY